MKTAGKLSDYRFPARYIEVVLEAWKECGYDVSSLLEAAELQHRYPLPVDDFISGQDILRLYLAGTRLYDSAYPFSLKLARHYNFTSIGLLGLAVVSAENLRQVIELLQRYFHLFFAGAKISYVIDTTSLKISYQVTGEFGSASSFLTEVIAGVIKRFTAYFTQTPQPTLVEFCHQAPSSSEEFPRYFGCPVQFEAAANCLHFSIKDLGTSPALSEASTLAQLEKQLETSLKKNQQEPSWTERTQQTWLDAVKSGIAPTLEETAASFNLTARTLERRLQQENTSFSQIVQELRLQRAMDLLTNYAIPIAEVAYRVGFQDSTAFSRFFKQSTGSTPAAFRAAKKEA